MRKNVFGRHFRRDKNERTALFKGLISSLFINESIQTTEHKAKAIKGRVDKLITKVKLRGKEATQFVAPFVTPVALEKLLNELGPRFAKRPGGFTRIIRLGRRLNDSASMVVIEFVEKATSDKKEAISNKKEVKTVKKVIRKKKETK